MPVVHLRQAVAVIGRFPALSGVDLDVEAGEIVILQGPNGAGKTSLLRLCAGLLAPRSGTAEVLGHDLAADRRSVRTRVGLLGHGSGLYDDLTVRENLIFWARASGVRDDESVHRALDRLGLADRLHEVPVRRLSAGQRRRTALAALAVRRPELWLLDEPHGTLDQQGRRVVDRLIRDAAAAGATVLVSTHELERVRSLGHRLVTLAGGAVHADDRLEGGADAA